MSSWLPNEATMRTYRLSEKAQQRIGQHLWVVHNQYQRVELCREKELFCRLTLISRVNDKGERILLYTHNNYGHDLVALKKVAVQNVGEKQIPVIEKETATGWILEFEGWVFGTEVV